MALRKIPSLIAASTIVLTVSTIPVSADDPSAGAATTVDRTNRAPARSHSPGIEHARESAGLLEPGAPGKGGMPTITTDIDPVLGIPAVIQRPNAHLLKPYIRLQSDLRLKYVRNRFSKNQPDLVWVPDTSQGRVRLTWQSYGHEGRRDGLKMILPGDTLVILDNELYDFGVGTLFVKVRNERTELTGFTLLETVIGDCDPANDELWVAQDIERVKRNATWHFGNLIMYPTYKGEDAAEIDSRAATLNDPTQYGTELSGGVSGGHVHPVYAANVVYDVLLSAVALPESDPKRDVYIRSAIAFFDN